MTDKEKITEILKAYTKKHNIMASSVILEAYAEELVANGVIVPPCKVGDKVYSLYFDKIESYVVTNFEIDSLATDGINSMLFGFESIGKTVFLTKEEAEERLKKINERPKITRNC